MTQIVGLQRFRRKISVGRGEISADMQKKMGGDLHQVGAASAVPASAPQPGWFEVWDLPLSSVQVGCAEDQKTYSRR